MTVRVTLPLKTVNESNGSHGHWSTKAQRRKTQRIHVHLAIPKWRATSVGLPAVVTLTRIAPSAGLDDDNLRVALKAVRDEVAASMGVDDRDPRVTWKYDQRRGSPKDATLLRGYGVTVAIDPA